MPRHTTTQSEESVYESYVLGVRIVEYRPADAGEPRYRFEGPEHSDVIFKDPETATLYADVYFAVNGFVEAETGDRGIPPEIVMAGKDALAAYMSIQTSVRWTASFYGAEPQRIERYISSVRAQADRLREQARREHTE